MAVENYVLSLVTEGGCVQEICGITTSALVAQAWASTPNHFATLVPVDGEIKPAGYEALRY